MVDPIRPDQVVTKKIPSRIIEAVNEMIQEAWDGSTATVYQDALVARICDLMQTKRETVFARGWLDFEPIFEEAGWRVTYDKPGYNESYKAFFRFER